MLSEWDRIEDDWHAYQGLAKEQWPRIDRTTLAMTGGRRDALIDAVERNYDISRTQARREVSYWLSAAPRIRRERADARRVPTGNRWSGQRRPRVETRPKEDGWMGTARDYASDYGEAAVHQVRQHPAATMLLAVGLGLITARLVTASRR